MADQFGKFVQAIDLGNEGDGVDRLHFGRTPIVCMFFSSVLILIKYMQIRPILCWIPYQFTNDHWVEFATYYCYVSNTFLPSSKDVFAFSSIEEIEKGEKIYLKYYQWVPFIFIFVAILFYLPRLLWQGILESEGINITAMVRSVNGFESALNPESRNQQLTALAKYMRIHFYSKKQKSSNVIKVSYKNGLQFFCRLFEALWEVSKKMRKNLRNRVSD